jgi:hypothetical protein
MTGIKWRAMLALVMSAVLFPETAMARLQCVPYARSLSGVDIRGNAKTWWGQAEGQYERGNTPRPGAVMAFRGTAAMPMGHVAYVAEILGPREVLLHHANWSRPGGIERAVRAIDVSDAGDWSQVRVWHSPTATMGARVNPVFGFIYRDSGHEAVHYAGQTINAPVLSSAAIQPRRILLAGEIYQLASLEAVGPSPSR